MNANLYIMGRSFTNNSSFSQVEIENKIKTLSADFVLIMRYKDENTLYINYEEIKNCVLYADITIENLLYYGHSLSRAGKIDRDAFNAFYNIYQKSSPTTLSCDTIIQDLPHYDKNHCNGIILFHKIEDICVDEVQIIYNISNWYYFRRYFLGLFPGNPDFFINECRKYFPNLFFHDNNNRTVGKILCDCPRKIIYHLAAINDHFSEYNISGRNRSDVLRQFSLGERLDTPATLEGKASRKNAFTFTFFDGHQTRDVCCEPHCKLTINDRDETFSNDRRIYFHEGFADFAEGKILIGHIGEHL